jgi:hypothetical protein
MKTCKLMLLALSLAVFTACKKEYNGTTTVYGHVYTKGTTNYPGDTALQMGIEVYVPGGIGSGGVWSYVDKFYTNNQGYYSFTFNATEGKSYRVRVAEGLPNHWPPFDYCFAYIEEGQRQNLNLELAPHAYLQLHVRNQINPQIWDDTLPSTGGGGKSSRSWYADFDDTSFSEYSGVILSTELRLHFSEGEFHYRSGGTAYPSA